MAEVTYRGGGMDGVTSNAASEATLQRLVALMEKGSKGGGAATEKMANDAKDAANDAADKVKEAGKEAADKMKGH